MRRLQLQMLSGIEQYQARIRAAFDTLSDFLVRKEKEDTPPTDRADQSIGNSDKKSEEVSE